MGTIMEADDASELFAAAQAAHEAVERRLGRDASRTRD
jgi:uncharacterized protein YqgV (UPF0045/DUF77 family)